MYVNPDKIFDEVGACNATLTFLYAHITRPFILTFRVKQLVRVMIRHTRISEMMVIQIMATAMYVNNNYHLHIM